MNTHLFPGVERGIDPIYNKYNTHIAMRVHAGIRIFIHTHTHTHRHEYVKKHQAAYRNSVHRKAQIPVSYKIPHLGTHPPTEPEPSYQVLFWTHGCPEGEAEGSRGFQGPRKRLSRTAWTTTGLELQPVFINNSIPARRWPEKGWPVYHIA